MNMTEKLFLIGSILSGVYGYIQFGTAFLFGLLWSLIVTVYIFSTDNIISRTISNIFSESLLLKLGNAHEERTKNKK